MTSVWDVLSRTPSTTATTAPAVDQKPRGRGKASGTNKTARMRASLAENPRTTRELADLIGEPTTAVYPLLKHDLRSGRIKHVAGKYYLVSEMGSHMPGQIQAAVKLLQIHGWRVVPPTVRPPDGLA